MGKSDKKNQRHTLLWLLPLSGLALIAMGVIMFFTPLANFIALTFFFAATMLVTGIMEVIGFFSRRRGKRSGLALGGGILSTLFGVWMFFGSGMLYAAIAIPFIFAAWVMTSGVIRVVDAVSRDNEKGKIKIGSLLFGFLGTVVGFSLLFNPMMSALIVARMIGVLVAIHGFGTISLFFHLRKLPDDTESTDTEK